MKILKVIFIAMFIFVTVGLSQDIYYFTTIDTILIDEELEDSEEKITSLDLTGSIEVMCLIIGFSDRTHTWPTFANDPAYPDEYYPLLGAFPSGTTLREYIAQNGPIGVDEWIEPGFETYLDKYSGGKYTADVSFPKKGNGEPFLTINNFQYWINVNGGSTSVIRNNDIEIIEEAAYNLVNYIPDSNPFDGIDMLQVSFVGITRDEFWPAHGGYTYVYPVTIRNPYNPNEVYFNGPVGISHKTGPILHEALHNIGTAVGTPQGFKGLPDRGHSTYVIDYHGNCTGVYDVMYHSGNSLMGFEGLYGNPPMLPYDLAFLGWIEEEEILEINDQNITNIRLENIADPLTQEQRQSTPPVYRLVKVMIHENYQNDWDEYFLISYHNANGQEINFDKALHNHDEGLYNEGVLIWHIKEKRNMINSTLDQQIDLELAQPHNGFYNQPIPNDSYPRDYERDSTWNGQWAGDFDWLDDLKTQPNNSPLYYYLPDGGRHIWETTVPPDIYPGGHYPWDPTGEDWFFRCNSLRSDFFTDEEIRGAVVNKMTDVTRPSTKDWGNQNGSNETHIAIVNIRVVNDYALLDVYFNYTETTNPIDSGWQIVSVPVEVEDYSANSVFPTHVGSIYGYEGGSYVVKNTLENGPGYWAKFNADQTKTHSGLIIDTLSIPVPNGWSFLGSITYDVVAANICTEPTGIITALYRYDSEYGYIPFFNYDLIEPGVGYWMKTNQSGTVTMSESCGMQKITAFPGVDLAHLDIFVITDSNGKQQSLYVANLDIDSTLENVDRSMPPLMPELEFDARFNSGEFLKGISVDNGAVDLEIDVETEAYPITLSWEINPENGIEYSFVNDSTLGKESKILVNKSQAKFNNDSNGKIKLFGKVSDSFTSNQVPNKFELYQNYPNPFNPITSIKYDIIKVQDVKLVVYDMLGREVATLVNAQQQPGTYEVSWDASNFASGIYFYQIRTKDYVDTQKMILLK